MTSTKQEQDVPYEVLPSGRKRYTRATVVDIVLSVILPLWGLVIGGLALVKGERKRGFTMIGVGAVFTTLAVLYQLYNASIP
jgi:hypothetical protein